MTTYRVEPDGHDTPTLWRAESEHDQRPYALASQTSVGDTIIPAGDDGVVFRAAAAVLAPDEEVNRAVSKRVNGCACKNCLGFTVAVLDALRAHVEGSAS